MTTVQEEIKAYIGSQPEPKRSELQALHDRMLEIMPGAELWFLDGKDDKNKVVANPNIGYGVYTIHYADGKTKNFYQIGLSTNTTGISVYIMGLKDKYYLPATYGKTIGKASVTGYCIKFKKLADIHLDVLETAVRDRLEQSL